MNTVPHRHLLHRHLLRCFCLCLLFSQVPSARPQSKLGGLAEQRKAVVTIYALGSPGAIGSGVVISPQGEILTCYHVVQNAHGIIVVTGSSEAGFSNVLVEQISPEADLALLRVSPVAQPLPYLPIAPGEPSHLLEQPLHIFGYLNHLQRQVIPASVTEEGEVRATDLKNGGEDVFSPGTKLTILPLVTTIFKGLSGGPLVSKEGVVGVVSGSISEGGSVAWAIPVSNLHSPAMHLIGKEPRQTPWTPLTLMATGWKNLRAEVPSADPTMAAAQRYINSSNAVRKGYADYRESVRAYVLNQGDVIEALGLIPARSQGLHSSDIARDPELRQLNGRIASLFHVSGELQVRMFAAAEQTRKSAEQNDADLHDVASELLLAVKKIPPDRPGSTVLNAVGAEMDTTAQRLRSSPFPQIRTPQKQLQNVDDVTIAELRTYIMETRSNLQEVLTPRFNSEVQAFLDAHESMALPVEHLLILSAR